METNIKELLYGREAAVIFIKQTNFNDDENEARLQSLVLKLVALRFRVFLVVLHHKIGYLAINKNVPLRSQDYIENVITYNFIETIEDITNEITDTETYILDRFDDLSIFDRENYLHRLKLVQEHKRPDHIAGLRLLYHLEQKHWRTMVKENIDEKRTSLMNVLFNLKEKYNEH